MSRNEHIRTERAAGHTLQHIADQHGITRERVRQIVNHNDQPKRRVLRQSRALYWLALKESFWRNVLHPSL